MPVATRLLATLAALAITARSRRVPRAALRVLARAHVLLDTQHVVVRAHREAELVDQSRIEGLLAQLTSVRMVTEADINASLSALQLDNPQHRFLVTLSGGETVELAIGGSSPTNTGYYVSLDGGTPRLVSRTALDSFIGLLDSPPLLPTPVPVEDTAPDSAETEVTP